MPIKQTNVITISCDGPKCKNTVTFLGEKVAHAEAKKNNLWLDNLRTITTDDQRVFSYCSDVCEVDAITSGEHNKKEEKKVVSIDTNTEFQIKQAAELARQAAEATQNLKDGKPVTLHTS